MIVKGVLSLVVASLYIFAPPAFAGEKALDLYREGKGYYENKEYKKALPLLSKAAGMGHTKSRTVLGTMYRLGRGVKKDIRKAHELYIMAGEKGNARAQFFLGAMFDDGVGVPPDPIKAFNWYLKAAEQEHPTAQLNLGLLYWKEKDYSNALDWFHKSAEKGNDGAQFVIGEMYSGGMGVKKNLDEARKWYTIAAKRGNVPARKRLKEMDR
jgi:hypothetical protein